MTDEAWPHGRHLSLSWFWLVWHHGAIHWSMVHGKEVLLVPCLSSDLSKVHQLSCCPSCYVSVLRGLFLYFRTLKLPKVTSRPCTNTWLNNRSQRWAEIFVGTLHIKATDTYIQMSSVVCARIEKRHLGILGRVQWPPSSHTLTVPLDSSYST